MEIYRFRSIHALLDGFHELENQEIYFAAPNELNDPVEGFKDIVWKGDIIVWTNLLKNYLCCLLHVYATVSVFGEKRKLSKDDIPIINRKFFSPTPSLKQIHDDAIEAFFNISVIKDLALALSERRGPIRRSELIGQLRIIHFYALEVVTIQLLENGLIYEPLIPSPSPLSMDESLQRHGSSAKIENEGDDNLTEELFEFFHSFISQKDLLNKISYTEAEVESNKFFLINEYLESFVNKLEDIIFPDWYSASFLNDYSNSVVWGHYGDKHTGVCLKFKIEGPEEQKFLNLKYKIDDDDSIEDIQFFFKKIEYQKKPHEIEFFKSLARMPAINLKKMWYEDENGIISDLAKHLDIKSNEWHESYWQNFYNCISTKSSEWEYEKEYRLILDGFTKDFHNITETKLKYDFNSLEGIIFGIKTSTSDKIRVVKIIRQKCLENNRDSFDFFQAKYSRISGKIEIEKLDVLSTLKDNL
ncbi:MAG: DUF2971 domain-containing protein [Bacteroidota bacterium]